MGEGQEGCPHTLTQDSIDPHRELSSQDQRGLPAFAGIKQPGQQLAPIPPEALPLDQAWAASALLLLGELEDWPGQRVCANAGISGMLESTFPPHLRQQVTLARLWDSPGTAPAGGSR